ncbi:MAG: 2,5-diamino-6-(ribosylamino)-4(3H)-pyrimidinone 5'-phosphate reductase [Methanoculleaceae archaeon]
MRPFVIVNVAMSADGKISTKARRQVRISGIEDFRRVDKLKSESDAVMVGVGTVLADNPSLTVKSPGLRRARIEAGLPENPVRIVVDSRGRTPVDAEILHKGEGPRIIAVSESAPGEAIEKLSRFATVIRAGIDRVDIKILLARLYEFGIRRLMVEGGGTLIWSLVRAGAVDEFCTYVGNLIIGGSAAPTPVDGEGYIIDNGFPSLHLIEATPMDKGILIRWAVKEARQ